MTCDVAAFRQARDDCRDLPDIGAAVKPPQQRQDDQRSG
jgi:hypothetical protein